MPSSPRPRHLLSAAVAVLATGALAGCAGITTTTDASFNSRDGLDAGWPFDVAAPAWIPDQVRKVHVSGHDGTGEVIVYVDTSAGLPEGACLEAPRSTAPAVTTGWSPNWETPPEQVWVCASWEVTPMANGWFGWTAPGV
ncbi:hypothetical protein [Agromyces silvae]|uniref:hypothetical protein n=1 Tax=Agromyces silvae TaxID=3388266 RepID=UPI00280A61D4|nr:hypothetical protein [Agromyces protaetiae]